jgi:hypothetical protein
MKNGLPTDRIGVPVTHNIIIFKWPIMLKNDYKNLMDVKKMLNRYSRVSIRAAI